MKKNKGITLTSLVIYVTLIFVVLAILTRITTHFSRNMGDSADIRFETEYNKINLYLLGETKKTGNKLINEENTETEKVTKIIFSTGNSYELKDEIIYLNSTIKICENVESLLFSTRTADNGKTVLIMEIKINDITKTTEYVMFGEENQTDGENIQDYLWGESLLRYYLTIGDYVNYVPETDTYTVAKGASGSGGTNDQVFSTQVDDETTEEDEALKWRVLSINNYTVELISETATNQLLNLKGAAAYNHGVDILNDLCEEIYSNSNGAIARHINANDLNAFCGYNYKNFVDGRTGYKCGDLIQMKIAGEDYMKYPNLYLLEQGCAPGGVVKNGLNPSQRYSGSYSIIGYTDSNAVGDDMYVTYNYYQYDLNKQTNCKGPIDLVKSNDYWVATRFAYYAYETRRIHFGIYAVEEETTFFGGSVCYMSSSANEYEATKGIRPIITVPGELFDFSVGDGSKEKPWGIK